MIFIVCARLRFASCSAFLREADTEDKAVQFLVRKHVFANVKECPKCNNILQLKVETSKFRCRATLPVKSKKKK